MSIKNKKIIVIVFSVIVVLLLGLIIFKVVHKDTVKKVDYKYYFTYVEDDNLISQQLKIYDKKGNVVTNYYVFNDNDEPIGFALNDNETATISVAALDLSAKKEIRIVFDDDKDIYNYQKVGLKEE